MFTRYEIPEVVWYLITDPKLMLVLLEHVIVACSVTLRATVRQSRSSKLWKTSWNRKVTRTLLYTIISIHIIEVQIQSFRVTRKLRMNAPQCKEVRDPFSWTKSLCDSPWWSITCWYLSRREHAYIHVVYMHVLFWLFTHSSHMWHYIIDTVSYKRVKSACYLHTNLSLQKKKKNSHWSTFCIGVASFPGSPLYRRVLADR